MVKTKTDKKTIGASALIMSGLLLASMIVPGFFDSPKYVCDSRPNLGIVECDDFSKYVASNGKCIRNDDTNLICKTGWTLVTNDLEIPEETEETIKESVNSCSRQVCKYINRESVCECI